MNNELKSLIISILIIFISTVNSQLGKAQLFNHPQAPLSVNWRQINAPHLKLVFPKELEKQANVLASKILAIQTPIYKDLNPYKTTYPTLLQNRGTNSNASVQLAPQLSQYYTTPANNFDSQNWLSNLAIHELRHMAQFDKLAKPRSFPLLQELQLAQIVARIPMWFLEGDAVFQESYLTQAGRGKHPQWIMSFRASLLSNETPSYSKAIFGSHKEITPGYYQIGYLMQSLWVKERGIQFIPQLFEALAKPRLELYNFSKTLNRLTGMNRKEWYKHNLDELKTAWSNQDLNKNKQTFNNQQPKLNPTQIISSKPKFATDYLYPFPLGNNQTLSLKQGKTDIPSLVIINKDQSETMLRKIGFQDIPWIHYAAGHVVWVEYRANPRYKQENFAVLCIYNINTKTTKQLSFKSRYFTPSLSPDGKKVVLIENDLSLQSYIVEIDVESGKILKKIKPFNDTHLENPSYDDQSQKVVFVAVNDSGKSIYTINTNKPQANPELIIGPAHHLYSNPKFYQDKIYFNGHLNGIDNIYLVDPKNKEIVALSDSKYGAFNAQLDSTQQTITFNNYTTLGLRIEKSAISTIPIGSDSFINFSYNPKPPITDSLLNDFNHKNLESNQFESNPYSKFKPMLNFHSLSLNSEKEYQTQLILKAENILSTVYWENGVSYDRNIKRFGYKSELHIKTFYPIIKLRYDNHALSSPIPKNKMLYEFISWRENRIKLGLNLPLSFNVYQRQVALNFETSTFYTHRYQFDSQSNSAHSITKTLKFPISYQLNFTHSWRRSIAEIAPKYAQSFSLKYFHQPFSKQLSGNLWAFQSSLFFPGLAKRHSFSMHANFQRQSGIWLNQIEIDPIYGYYNIATQSNLKQVLLLHYKFPLAYPDWELSQIAYIKQINLGFFNHYENPTKIQDLKNPKTFGLELNTKLHLFQYLPLIDLGTRLIFVNQSFKQKPILEVTFNYSL